MRHSAFLVERQLRGRLAQGRVEENRVVAKPAVAGRRRGNLAVHPRLRFKLHARAAHYRQRGDKTRLPARPWQ